MRVFVTECRSSGLYNKLYSEQMFKVIRTKKSVITAFTSDLYHKDSTFKPEHIFKDWNLNMRAFKKEHSRMYINGNFYIIT